MGQTLEPGQILAHFRVVGPIGAGGMGEVYLAHDQTLERNVALKVLPADLVSNEQRLRRFVLEAKSASSLNHPNIITIHEIGQVDDPSGAIHFIAMEYVDGATLGEKIHRDKADLRTLLGWLAQAAEGLAKAHAAGIVHRDLKPGNIMVTRDGFTKVLDFGLAKLTDSASDPGADTRTAIGNDLTGHGGIVGTAAYMSPEQAAGRTVDARSDIFSFGCILYEAAARQRPFAAETGVETMNKILNEQPAPLEELNPAVPADLRKLIRRCLAKNPEQRCQSIKDVAIELREIVEGFDSLPRSGRSGESGSNAPGLRPARRRLGWPLAAFAAGALLVGIPAVWFIQWRGATAAPPTRDPAQALTVTSVVSGMSIESPALSPDGRLLGYVRKVEGGRSLIVRQVSSGSEITVISGQRPNINHLRFAPGGETLYYRSSAPDSPSSTVFAIPSLGGAPRKILDDVDSAVVFAPDGMRLGFVRNAVATRSSQIMVFDLSALSLRTVSTIRPPEALDASAGLYWSADGRTLTALVASTIDGGGVECAASFDIESGRRQNGASWQRLGISGGAWLSSERLIVSGAGPFRAIVQLLELSPGRPRGQPVTNDDSAYDNPTLSADGRTLAALRTSPSLTLWSAASTGSAEPRPIQLGVINPFSIRTALDGTLLFRRLGGEESAIWRADRDGTNARRISPDAMRVTIFRPIPGTNALVFSAAGADMVKHVWRMDNAGGSLTQLTRGTGESLVDVSRDGKFLLTLSTRGATDQLMRSSIETGEGSVPVGGAGALDAWFSPDGTLVLQVQDGVTQDGKGPVAAVYPAGGGARLNTLDLSGRMNWLDWWVDSSALMYLADVNGVDTVMRLPLGGGMPTPVLPFPYGRIHNIWWSPDRRTLLIAAKVGVSSNFWVWNPGGAAPRQITRFLSGGLTAAAWSPDGSTIYFTQGNATRDIVLIRGFD